MKNLDLGAHYLLWEWEVPPRLSRGFHDDMAARFMNDDGQKRIGAVRGDILVDWGPAVPAGFVPTGEAWTALPKASSPAFKVDSVRLLHPVQPSKILYIGLNYVEHARESGMELPAAPPIFVEVPSALVGPGEAIVLPGNERPARLRGRSPIIADTGKAVVLRSPTGHDAGLARGAGHWTGAAPSKACSARSSATRFRSSRSRRARSHR